MSFLHNTKDGGKLTLAEMYCHCSHKKINLIFGGGGLGGCFLFYPQCRQRHLLERLSLPKGSDFIILAWVSYCCLTPFICATTSILTAIMSCNLPAGRWENCLDLCIEQKLIFFCLFLFPTSSCADKTALWFTNELPFMVGVPNHEVSPVSLTTFCF